MQAMQVQASGGRCTGQSGTGHESMSERVGLGSRGERKSAIDQHGCSETLCHTPEPLNPIRM